jgi:phosphatidate cytidylyltransferase
MQRLITAALLGGVVWLVVKKLPPAAFVALAVVFTALAAWEAYRMLGARGGRPFRVLGTAACAAIALAFGGLTPGLDPVVPIFVACAAATIAAMARRATPEARLDAAAWTVFPVVFLGLPLGYAVALRAVPGENGSDLILLLIVCVTFADSAAYYAGRAFGRHRMAPTISPKKTWEGAAGALAGSLAGAALAHVWFFQRLRWEHAAALALLLGAAGMLGDLAESMIKRATGVKDSSALLPGHGGVLDRMDSLLFSAPVLYYYWRVFLEGTL